MNDPCIVYELVLHEKNKRCLQEWFGKVPRFFKKDKTHVDILMPACIVPYIEAAELYKSLHTSNNNINMVTLKDLLTDAKFKDVLKMVVNA